ncbi:TlpA family protein disulfide reductase [Niastella caeni]|nr:thioredoxin fold domain-containing protein [Niastella caeni]
MKHTALLIILVCLSSCLSKKREKTKLEGKLMPSFNLLLLDSGAHFNTNNIPKGMPIVIFYFSPECPICRAETEEIVTNIKSLANIQFYIITHFPLEQIKIYYDRYKLKKYRNITLGCDYNLDFGNYFKVQRVPYIAIYSNDKRLKQVLTGKVSTDVIKEIAFK